MAERMPNIGESAWHNILGANDGSGGFLRVTHNDDGTLRPQLGQPITASALTADTNDWNPTGFSTTTSVIKVGSTTAFQLSGLSASAAGATDGRVMTLMNTGSARINVAHSVSSASANQFYCAASVGDIFPLYPAQQCEFLYDGVAAKWKLLGGGPKGVGTPLAAGTATPGTLRYYSSEDHVHPLNGASILIGDSGVLAASATTIDFSGISGSYAHLFAIVYARTNQAVAMDDCLLRINNISTNTYDYMNIDDISTTLSGGVVPAASSIDLMPIPGGSATANIFGGGFLFIPHYAGSSNRKTTISLGGGMDTESATTTNWEMFACIGKNRANTAITQLTFGCGTFGTTAFAVGSRITLYGLGV